MLQYVSIGSTLPSAKGNLSSRVGFLDCEDLPSSRSLLSRISNVLVRNVVLDMTQRQPDSRLSVSDYLDILHGKKSLSNCTLQAPLSTATQSPANTTPSSMTCPSYFDGFLYPLFLKLHWNGVTPDLRINIICEVLSFGLHNHRTISQPLVLCIIELLRPGKEPHWRAGRDRSCVLL